jgi:hypothetical protein
MRARPRAAATLISDTRSLGPPFFLSALVSYTRAHAPAMLQRHDRTSAAAEKDWAFALPSAAAAQAGRLLERLGDSRRGLQRRGAPSAAAAPSTPQAPPRRRAAPLFATMSASADAAPRVVNRRRNGGA